MNQHPAHTSEYLAQQCLDAARGDYALARDLILAYEAGERRDHAVAALAIWAALGPVLNANDNEPDHGGVCQLFNAIRQGAEGRKCLAGSRSWPDSSNS